MYKDVLVFYGPLPLNEVKFRQLSGSGLNEKISATLYRAIINDLLAEYNPFLEEEYDFVYCYTGDLNEFRTRYKYNFRRYVSDLGKGDRQVGLMHIHTLMARSYDRIIMVGGDYPYLTKRMIKEAFRFLREGNEAVMIPSLSGRVALFGMNGFEDVYSNVMGWDAPYGEGALRLSNDLISTCNSMDLRTAVMQPIGGVESLSDVVALYETMTRSKLLLPEYTYLPRCLDAIQKYAGELGISC